MQNIQHGVLVEKPRVSSIDIARGLVMVIMVLDHVRHFMHADALLYEPTELSKTTPVLFFTRWITHFCAPAFLLLAGMAIRISSRRKSPSALRTFLLTRGLWLLVLEVVVMRFSFTFNWYFDLIFFQVIWAIGGSMIVLAALIRLNEKFILALSLIILFGHNGLDQFNVDESHPLYIPFTLLFQPGYIPLADSGIMVMYPLVPWLAVLMLGYVVGKWFANDFDKLRQPYLFITGCAMVVLFVILRFTNFYGDPHRWEVQQNFTYTLLSFLNCEKYPPSLLYLLMTLGPVFMTLAALDKIKTIVFSPLQTIGRVPLFFYIIHFLLIHIVALVIFMIQTETPWSAINFHATETFGGITPGNGISLPMVHVAWIGIVLVLYPMSWWYNRIKSQSKHWFFRYV